MWSPEPRSRDKNLWNGPSPVTTVAVSLWIYTILFPGPTVGKIPTPLPTLEHSNQSPNATLPCLEAIKISDQFSKGVGFPLSWLAVLTASPALINSILFPSVSCPEIFFSSPCTDHDRADWVAGRAARHSAAPVAGKRIQGQCHPETTRHLHHHMTLVDLARMCELRRPPCDTSVRNLEW